MILENQLEKCRMVDSAATANWNNIFC